MYILYYFISIILFLIVIRTEVFNIFKELVRIKYNKWKSLNSLVSTKHKSKHLIVFNSIKLLLHMIYINFIQYMNNTVVKHNNNNTYILTYTIKGKLYKNIIKPIRGPNPIIQVINNKDEDVTEQILPYIGPRNDWNNNNIKPSFFEYDSLTFELSNGKEISFAKNDILKFD
jgi:hypothetical protein